VGVLKSAGQFGEITTINWGRKMGRAKFNYNDVVRVKLGGKNWRDVPGRRTSGQRVGELASVCGITTDRKPGQMPDFPSGVIYTVEFSDGDSIEIHEDALELVEPSETN